MFAHDVDAGRAARSLRVSTKSVYQWRRAWRVGGEAVLALKGPDWRLENNPAGPAAFPRELQTYHDPGGA
jgi:hypothetical protein